MHRGYSSSLICIECFFLRRNWGDRQGGRGPVAEWFREKPRDFAIRSIIPVTTIALLLRDLKRSTSTVKFMMVKYKSSDYPLLRFFWRKHYFLYYFKGMSFLMLRIHLINLISFRFGTGTRSEQDLFWLLCLLKLLLPLQRLLSCLPDFLLLSTIKV